MVVSCQRLGNGGRLGNQLFAIGATLGIAERTAQKASFPLPWAYAKFFDIALENHGIGKNQYNERHYHYDDSIHTVYDCDLVGYYQSPKYFPEGWKPKIKKDIIDHHKANKAFEKETIGIHIRRGDYVNHELYYQLPITWYISALLSIPNWKDCNIVIVSDDLEYCKVHFEALNNAFFPAGYEVDHLCLLSLCDHHIIGNSTFGFFGAYMSEQKDVIHSGKMFRGSFSHKDIKDFYPENWKVHKQEKIDLSDVTFTIPILYDHSDRKQNFNLTLCCLQKDFYTNIIVGEQGKEKKFEYCNKWAKYHYFEGMQKFHRTKMLNDMAIMSETELIVNFDTDVIIPPLQIYLAAERLRSGVDCVYPYDGRFARMDRIHWFKKVEREIDIGCVRNSPLDHRTVRESVGGAVMWRKESFIDFGMENEYMISYAPEDVERWERMHTLGVNVQRINGTLFHMNHYKGIDSHNGNPLFPANKAELEKMRAMSKDEMRKYIDTWKWRHQYTESYYRRISEGAIRSAKETYPVILNHLWKGFPTNCGYKGGKKFEDISVIDIGCGVGEWSCGNPNYIGVDHNIPEKALMIPKEQYVNCDLEVDGMLAMYDAKCFFDLCLCLEVAEHISEQRADFLIKMLCGLSDNVLFSAAIINQGGTGHCNEQMQTYWAEKFYLNGFGASLCYPVEDNENVEMWYRQNMILYKRGATERVYNFVLPEYYEQITNYLKNR